MLASPYTDYGLLLEVLFNHPGTMRSSVVVHGDEWGSDCTNVGLRSDVDVQYLTSVAYTGHHACRHGVWVCSSTSADTSPHHDGASAIAVRVKGMRLDDLLDRRPLCRRRLRTVRVEMLTPTAFLNSFHRVIAFTKGRCLACSTIIRSCLGVVARCRPPSWRWVTKPDAWKRFHALLILSQFG